MKVLCIDVGNTSTHIGLIENRELLHEVRIATHPGDPFLRRFGELLRGPDFSADSVSFCSVVPSVASILRKWFAEHSVAYFELSYANCPGLSINYPKPEEIGSDRLANSIGAMALFGAPAIVIDLGTAITFDVVTRNGYEGGIIAPGLEIMTRYLHQQTALLPKLDSNSLMASTGIGKTTTEAMEIGCAVGFDGMVRALLERIIETLKAMGECNPHIIITGGNAGVLSNSWLKDVSYHPFITLVGLAESCNPGI